MKDFTAHIGTHKTGTTAIQRFLTECAVQLKSIDIHYPVAGRLPGGSHHNLVWELVGDSRFNAAYGTWEDLHREVEDHGDLNVIVSCEALSTWEGSQIGAAFIADFAKRLGRTPRAVLYLRPQPEYLEALYLQEVKSGQRVDDFETYLKRSLAHPRFNYHQITRVWSESVDLEVRPFTKEQKTVGVVADFLNTVGIDAKHLNASLHRRDNDRLSLAQTEAIRLVTERLWKEGFSKKQTEEAMSRLVRFLGKTQPIITNESLLTLECFDEICRHYEASNELLFEAYPHLREPFAASRSAKRDALNGTIAGVDLREVVDHLLQFTVYCMARDWER